MTKLTKPQSDSTAMSAGQAADCLKKIGVRPSSPRVAIFRYLCEKRNHPTVDTIFQHLAPEHPSLSRTTVYNTLKLFAKHNAIQLITIDGSEMRYDANISIHGHFQCDICGKVEDIFADELINFAKIKSDFHIRETQIYFRGCCDNANCQSEFKKRMSLEETD